VYDGVVAVSGITLSVPAGEMRAVLGANGAGKTSMLKAIAGGIPAARGRIRLSGVPIETLPSHRRCRAGVMLVPEGRRMLAGMTVEENLLLGIAVKFSGQQARLRLKELFAKFPILYERRAQLAGLLSGGEQQQLAIARGIASRPQMLLLDEPSLGLAPMMIDTIFQIVVDLNRSGMTILLVEQNARKALEIVTHAYLMEAGRLVLEGSPAELRSNDAVQRAYLGG
jgi:branched-chain amino acid transport system ATP-binding protein